MGLERLLVIDSCISKKVASTLRNRGRESASLAQLGLSTAEDPEVLRVLHDRYAGCVLVTADDHMPEDHADLVDRYKPTLAIVDPRVGKEFDQSTDEDLWKWEVCMRWAHRMQEQEPQSVKRYNDSGGREWKRPRTPKIVPKRKKAKPPEGLASSDPIIPKAEESHKQGQFEFGPFDGPIEVTEDTTQEG